MIELPMDLMEYDAMLRSITYIHEHVVRYDYGGVTAQILADKFEDCNMPLHVDMFRNGRNWEGVHGLSVWHPYLILVTEISTEEFISLVHYRITNGIWHEDARAESRYNVKIDPSSTLDNPILHWYT